MFLPSIYPVCVCTAGLVRTHTFTQSERNQRDENQMALSLRTSYFCFDIMSFMFLFIMFRFFSASREFFTCFVLYFFFVTSQFHSNTFTIGM